MDDPVSLAFMEGPLLFYSGKCRAVLDQLRASYPWLVLDGTEDLVDGEPHHGEVLFPSEGLE